MIMDMSVAALAAASGSLVGLVLGLVGGGGSILAVPLLVYIVGVSSPHIAIGTAAIAVAINAAVSLAAHARLGTVKWPCAIVFALSGIIGTYLGTVLGKAMDGKSLLALFGILMIAAGINMLRPNASSNADVRLTTETAAYLLPRLIPIGLGVGLLAGFFGIGGGFLIVPGLILATGMPPRNAIATSLVAVTAFGLTTAGSYAASGLIDWPLAATFIAGGLLGGVAGVALNNALRVTIKPFTPVCSPPSSSASAQPWPYADGRIWHCRSTKRPPAALVILKSLRYRSAAQAMLPLPC